VLPLCYADCRRLVLPFVMAQDAEGEGEGGLGGWGLGVSAPPPSEIVALALQHLSRTVPSQEELLSGTDHSQSGSNVLSDKCIPVGWTDGATK